MCCYVKERVTLVFQGKPIGKNTWKNLMENFLAKSHLEPLLYLVSIPKTKDPEITSGLVHLPS